MGIKLISLFLTEEDTKRSLVNLWKESPRPRLTRAIACLGIDRERKKWGLQWNCTKLDNLGFLELIIDNKTRFIDNKNARGKIV